MWKSKSTETFFSKGEKQYEDSVDFKLPICECKCVLLLYQYVSLVINWRFAKDPTFSEK